MADTGFEAAYAGWFAAHSRMRAGERLRRLLEGHGHAEKMLAEKVWWPAFGHFDALHPEFEITDFRDGTRFLDFAFLPHPLLGISIEVDGYGPHLKHISRTAFSDPLNRQSHLTLDGWKILRFSNDDVVERPRMCQQILQPFKGRYMGVQTASRKLGEEEKVVARLALGLGRSVKPVDVCGGLGVESQKARRLLKGLTDKGLLVAMGPAGKRVARYRLSDALRLDDWGR
jgi:hypothetical protein